ncbi:MAG TPA: hypothetical protein PKW82_11120 [Spirochaetales bacterium]|nr:hypothetical protein [Spirochaetales bacterium]
MQYPPQASPPARPKPPPLEPPDLSQPEELDSEDEKYAETAPLEDFGDEFPLDLPPDGESGGEPEPGPPPDDETPSAEEEAPNLIDGLSIEEGEELLEEAGEPGFPEPEPESEPGTDADAGTADASPEPGTGGTGSAEAGTPDGAPDGSGEGSDDKPWIDPLGEKTAELLAYLRGLAGELPPEKKAAFDQSGLGRRIDGLITAMLHEDAEPYLAPPPEAPKRRAADRVAAEAPRRRADDRAVAEPPRRRESDRTLPETPSGRRWSDRLPPELATERPPRGRRAADLAPQQAPADEAEAPTVLGIPVSLKMAKLIEIMKREKNDGRR